MTLELQRVSAGYGGMDVIHDIDLTVRPREIVTLVGANGAGKSTLVKTISGLTPTRAGTITFNGERIETASDRDPNAPWHRPRAGRSADILRAQRERKP